ncbi:NFACT family protein [Pontibacillus salicampi]|uniref:Rqc2 homolog RqcH n=1 Tax=Pontibacillus salicampi TaxID=1449801 RepID=A0ABV6LNW7_9BACI
MSFDGVVTRAISHELHEKITPGRIMKIYQPTQTELVFTVRSQGVNHSLLLSAHPSYARIHLTKEKYQNPKEPPMFCMLLRKHLIGGFIESIEQVDMERVIRINVRSKDEIGDETTKSFIVEIMGKHSNLLLVDDEREMILDCIKHVSPAQNTHRTLLPGNSYIGPPDQGKTNPLSIDGDTFVRKLDFNSGKMDKQIMGLLQGFSPLIATELVYRAGLGSQGRLKEEFESLQHQILHHTYEPAILTGDKEQFYVLSLASKDMEEERYDSVNEMLDAYFSGKAERDRVKQRAGDLSRFLKNELEKNKRKIKKHEQTLKKAEKADEYQKYGELLTAHMHLVKQGDTSVTVHDYYKEEQPDLTVELNPNKTPSENAQSYFQTYNKMKKSGEVVQEEIKKAKENIDYLDQLLQQIDAAREEDIEEIREELREEGYLRAKPQQKKKKQPSKPKPDSFVSTDGVTILVGKNNKQNEYVTSKMAHRDDIWLHTKDIPGSHVVIRESEPSEETLIEAAQLAAYFSKSRSSSSVPVDYTLVRHVKKPNGAKPGFVTYDNQKTVFVTPDEAIIRSLRLNTTKAD